MPDLYDPHWDNVVFYAPFDEGHRRIPVDVKQDRTLFASGQAMTTTDVTLFGKSVGYTNGVNQRFFTASLAAYALGELDLTIEGFIQPVNAGFGANYGRMFTIGERDTQGGFYWVHRNNANPLKMLTQTHDGSYNTVLPNPSATIPDNQFTHVALCRQGDTYYEFYDGDLVGTETDAIGKDITENFYNFGRSDGNVEQFQAYFAHWRVTAGVARYTASFTPTDGPFPRTGTPPTGYGQVSGQVTIENIGVPRHLVAVTFEPQSIEGGGSARQVVGETISGLDGTYTMQLPEFQDPVIVLALDDYGQEWQPSTVYAPGDRIRPTPGNATGYVYECIVGGTSASVEPAWWDNTGGGNTGQVGSATFEALESWWPHVHAPVTPIWVPTP